jgi:chromosome segregation ATPase
VQEGMLNKLQNHVEQEEERWRQQLQMKDSELEAIREENDQLQQSLEQVTEDNDQLQESLEKLQRTEEVRV